MARLILLVACAFALVASVISSSVVEHTFLVKNQKIELLCSKHKVTMVNGSMPGPTISVTDGDTLIIHVLNQSPVNISLHWHGLFQRRSGWADGAAYITQCPIVSGSNYTYKFNITGQEGTLWWHNHKDMTRATIYGAFIIYPKAGPSGYPFPIPYKEVPIIFGEWWNGNIVAIENQGISSGLGPSVSDAFTINGQPGHLHQCHDKDIFKLKVKPGMIYLLRIINAGLNTQLFFKIANHTFTVVAVDASYTQPYVTDVIVSGPGQTVDALLVVNQPPKKYFMAIRAYKNAIIAPVDNKTATAILEYEGSDSSHPKMPVLPPFNDTPTAYKFYSNLTSPPNLVTDLPLQVDKRFFITIGMSLSPCGGKGKCSGPNGMRLSANMNSQSFQLPSNMSILQASFLGAKGVFTEDFPSRPPVTFDYTNATKSLNQNQFAVTQKSTRVKKIPFNSTVEIVFQNTAIIGVESHPMHIHGYDFYVLAMGFGNYKSSRDKKKFNLFNPQKRNTVAVPTGGWAVVRFRADNPGTWALHCHLETHLSWGLLTAFIVEEGPTHFYKLPRPPSDYPKC